MINDNNIAYRNWHIRRRLNRYVPISWWLLECDWRWWFQIIIIILLLLQYFVRSGDISFLLVAETCRYCAWILSLLNTIRTVPCRMMSTFFVGTADRRCIYMRPQTLDAPPTSAAMGGAPGVFAVRIIGIMCII